MRQAVRATLVLVVLAVCAALPATASADAASYRSMVMADEPAGYWQLEEKSGALGRNEVAGGQRLRYFQHPLLEEEGAFAGSRGASAGFRSLLDLGPPVGPDSDATYETWFRIQTGYDFSDYEHVIEVTGDWGVWIYEGRITVGCTRGVWGVGPRLTDSQWHHIALRMTDDRAELFVDGTKVIDEPCDYDRAAGRVIAGWGGGRIGWTPPSARAYDEMAMYDRALPDSRIAAHAAARTAADAAPQARAPLTGGPYTSAVLADDPYAYFRFEDRPFRPGPAPNRKVEDASGNGHHGDMPLGGMDRAPGPIASEEQNVSIRPRAQGFWIPGPTSADLSVEVWVKLNHETERSVDNAWIGGGRFAMLFRGEELSVPPAHLITWQDNLWNDHAWHHIVATKDTATDTLTIYRDGRFQRAMPDADDTPYFNALETMVSLLGGNALDPGHCVDEISIYEKVLSPARVAAHYDAADAERAVGGCGGTSDVRPDLRPPAPQNTSPPQAKGVAEPGSVVWCDPGEWTGDPHDFRQLWYRDGVALHASDWAYQVTALDAGHELTCRVVATGPGGDSVEVSSAPVGAVGRLQPPGQPHLLYADEDVRAAVTLDWAPSPADPLPADGYIVQIRDADGDWHEVTRPQTPPVILFNQPEGRMVYRVIAHAGGVQSDPSPESDPVMIDRTAPNPARLVVAGSPAWGDWYRDAVTASWEHDGDPALADGTPGSGLDPASVPPGQVSFSTTGAHVAGARLRDRAGNSAVTERVLLVDADAPVVDLVCPAVTYVGDTATVTVNASDAGAGLDAAVPSTLPVDTTTTGDRAFALTVRDRVGHVASDSCTVPVLHRRPNAPRLVGGTSPGNGAVTLAWTRHPAAPAPATYVLEGRDADDAAWREIARGAAESWSAPAGAPLAQGTWTFRVRVVDPAFDPSPSDTSDAVVVDRTAPGAPAITADRAADASGDWFRDTVTLSFAGSDPALPDGSPGSGVDPSSVPASATYATAGSHTASGSVRDRAGNTSATASRTVRVDTSVPSVSIACPAADVIQDSTAAASWTASDTGSGLAGAASGTVTLATAAIGTQTASAPAVRDRVGHVAATASCTYRVIYDWTGFLDPVTSGPEYNRVDAGDTVPILFSLDGDRGLGVLAGAPATVSSTDCNGQRNDVAWTLPATWSSGLQYYAQYDAYLWPFVTQASWRNTCRRLTVTLADGTSHSATFRFK